MISGLLAISIAIAPVPLPSSPVPQDTSAGKQVYGKWCAGCHGDNGAGDGPAAKHMIPPPRDFTGAIYQIRSTPSGQLPTDADLLRSIDEGLFGTAMPGWKSRLSDRQRRDVVLALGKPLERDGEAQSQRIARDRLPRGRAELAREVKRRAAQRATESAEVPAVCWRAGEECPRPLDSQPLPRPKRAIVVARFGECSRKQSQQQQRGVLRLELVRAGVSKGAIDNPKSEMVAGAEIADAPLCSTDRILDQIGRKCEDRARVAITVRMSDTVLVVGTEHQRGVGVDDSGLALSLDEEDTPARKVDLSDPVEHERPVARAGHSTVDVIDANQWAPQEQARRLGLGHASH